MKRIAILGCENSHADAFLKFIREREEFADLEVVGVYSEEADAVARLQERFAVPALAHYADAVGQLDGLIVTARHGANHYKYAAPYIESGIPMFIDKPITVDGEEAISFMQALKANGVRVCGGSSLKQDAFVAELREDARAGVDGPTVGGYVCTPYDRSNPYGNFYFYAQHLVEIVCEIFGRNPLSVTARENGEQIHVLFHYEGYDCVGLFANHRYLYFAARMAQKKTKSYEIPSTNEWFYRELSEFHALLQGGEQHVTYSDFIAPVFIMNAIERALQSGKEEPICYPKI